MAQSSKILVYHAVSEDRDFPTGTGINVIPRLWEEQLLYLGTRFTVVSLERAIKERARPDPSRVALTFDDGYEDSYKRAYPALKKCGIPATFFLTVSQIGNDWEFPWGLYPGLTWEQVKEMDRNPLITIGSHGYGHKILNLLGSH